MVTELPTLSPTDPPANVGVSHGWDVARANRDWRESTVRFPGNEFQPDGRPARPRGSLRSGRSNYDEVNRRARRTVSFPEISEVRSPGGTTAGSYSPLPEASASDVMETAAANMALLASLDDVNVRDGFVVPLTQWRDVAKEDFPSHRGRGARLPGGGRAIPVLVAVSPDDDLSDISTQLLQALKADSPGAPATHKQAMARGELWIKAETKEIGNHKNNESWIAIPRSEVPEGRRIHKLIWVYKVKRDGSAKARLCVQGNTLEAGIDFDQVFSAALRYSSARGLFAYAARHGCRVRSVDLVAAYLQASFVEGEVVYCKMAEGYVEYDADGKPMIAKVQKPIYGIQQAGRRLQRMFFAWLLDQGFKQLDDSDPCVFVKECPDGEILALGCYVDNLQIVHSAVLDDKGRGPEGCFYNNFMDCLARDWDVLDEGPMADLLGIEADYLKDGSIKLHQKSYIDKIVSRFLPTGPSPKAQRGSLPYSPQFLQHISDALSQDSVDDPDLVKRFQEMVGCLMYAATSTRPDIAFAVHQLCKCLQKPTADLITECEHVFSYLHRHASAGLTFSREQSRLAGFADASWEVGKSTSGWVVLWQSAALSWGSRKQKSIALSTCEAEIIALSEATKDVVYLRKLVDGLGDTEPEPTQLATDSQSARDVSYNPMHHDRMKHVQRRHFFVRDMVESFEIRVPYVPTNENIADFFTKPLAAKKFHAMRCIIMNEREIPAKGSARGMSTAPSKGSVQGG